MGDKTSLLAIKDSQSEHILDIVSDYYKEHNLTLVEERIGNRIGKYTNAKKSYLNLEEYQQDAYPPTRPVFTTNFDFYENLDVPWKAFVYYPDYPIFSSDVYYSLDINSELAKLISEKLNTKTIIYTNEDTVSYYNIQLYNKGVLSDWLNTSEEVFHVGGYFKNRQFNKNQESLYAYVDGYLKSMEFYDQDNNISINFDFDETKRRPMYLKGHPNNIVTFFHYQGKLR